MLNSIHIYKFNLFQYMYNISLDIKHVSYHYCFASLVLNELKIHVDMSVKYLYTYLHIRE